MVQWSIYFIKIMTFFLLFLVVMAVHVVVVVLGTSSDWCGWPTFGTASKR